MAEDMPHLNIVCCQSNSHCFHLCWIE
jgi:hypothetical protein